jgi:transglutaminase-like putative cysteine protease
LPRTLFTSLLPAVVIAAAWLRLESPATRPWHLIAIVALAGAAALARPRPLAALAAAVPALRLAFGTWPRHLDDAAVRFGNGFLDFYEVKSPFDPRVHTEMRGVVLIAIFAFVLLTALAVSWRKTPLAVAGVVAGAGWPATLAGANALLGVAILAAVLAVLAGLTSRHVPRVVVPAVVVIALAALAATASSAVAKDGVVDWQTWDFYNAPVQPVSVSYVWDANYSGIHFPRKRTIVLEVEAPPTSLFWRAAVLDEFVNGRWIEVPPRRVDALGPEPTRLLKQRVHDMALAERRLVGASVPVAFDAGDAPVVSRVKGFAELPDGLTRGFEYDVESYAPHPTAEQLARSRAVYPDALTPLRVAPEDLQYQGMYRIAREVTRGAATPFAKAATLLRWFREDGGFRYSNQGTPLPAFVERSRAGYCQHFAGAMALMLRYLGVPARVAVGFSSGTYNTDRRRWIVTDHDAHAWVEVWFDGYGWLPFDPTPSGRPERGQLGAPYAVSALSGEVPGVQSGAAGGPRRGGPQPRGAQEGTGVRPGFKQAPLVAARGGSLLLLALLLVAAVVGGIAATKLVLRRARYVTRDPRRVAAACRLELAEFLLDQQLEGVRSATLHELGALVERELGADADAFVAAATAARFGRPDGSARAAREARRELRRLLRGIRHRLNTRSRVRGLLSLRSLGFAA